MILLKYFKAHFDIITVPFHRLDQNSAPCLISDKSLYSRALVSLSVHEADCPCVVGLVSGSHGSNKTQHSHLLVMLVDIMITTTLFMLGHILILTLICVLIILESS